MALHFLYEDTLVEPGERDAAKTAGFNCIESVVDVCSDSTVLARHMAWPWPRRLERDAAKSRSRLVNGTRAYNYCDTPSLWSRDLVESSAAQAYSEQLVPRIWSRLEEAPEKGPYVLKWANNGKVAWERMYAPTRADALRLWREVQRDPAYRNLEVVIRNYVPLRQLGERGVYDEYRLFCYRGTALSAAFRWQYADCTERPPVGVAAIPAGFLKAATSAITEGGQVDYYALDVAITDSGHWRVMGVSDGQRASLGNNDPYILYEALFKCLRSPKSA